MSLKEITDVVQARFKTDGGIAAFAFGGEHIGEHGEPPRIIWVPRGGAFGPVDHGGRNPKPLKTRNIRVFAHIWGKDYEATEDLLNRLAAAAHTVAGGSIDFGSEDWSQQNEQFLAHGRVVIVDFTFRVPVTAPAQQTATITSVPQTPEFES